MTTGTSQTVQEQAIAAARSAFARLPNGGEVFRECVSQQDSVIEVVKTVLRAQESHASKTSTRILQRFEKYTSWLQNMSTVVDVAVQTHAGLACPIWAPIKFVLKVSRDHSNAAEQILRLIQTISDSFPRFEIYEKLGADPVLQASLLNIFTDVVEFSVLAAHFFKQRAVGIVFYHRLFPCYLSLTCYSSVRLANVFARPFDDRFGDIFDRIRRHAKDVDSTAIATQLLKAAEHRTGTLRWRR